MLLIDKPNTTHTYLARGRFRLSLWARAMGASTKRRPSPRALNISAVCNGPPVVPVDWFEAPVHQHVGSVLLGFFLVLGIFVTFVTAAYTFVQDSGASGYEVTGWAVICAPLVFPLQIVKAFLRVQAKVQRVLNQVSSFCRSSHVIKIIVAVLYTLLYVVFIASLLLFGVILLLSFDGRNVQSFSEGVPLYEIACIASLILTRGASAQRLAFVLGMLFVLQLLPGVNAMDGAGAAASESGSANGPSLWSTAGAFVCHICRHACHRRT